MSQRSTPLACASRRATIWRASSNAPGRYANPSRVPRILKAIRGSTGGEAGRTQPSSLAGQNSVDPNEDDFYRHVVEQKEAHKADENLRKGLKCIGNAGAYGPLVELNELRESTEVKLNVYSDEHTTSKQYESERSKVRFASQQSQV
jgi:hypothetical protein